MEKKDPPIIIETIYQNSIEEVWSALTEPDKMKQWFFQEMPDFQAKVGFETSFPIIVNGRTYTHQWNPDDIPEFKRESGVEGWTYLLKERLAGFLTNHERPTD